ncbi:hypothetical protein JXR93_13930 [bacterium]|nr:hypothetical protein [bacterium]
MRKLIVLVILFISISLFAKVSEEEMQKQFKKADSIMLQISEHTGRKPDLDVKKAFTSKKEVIDYVKAQLDQQYKGNEFLVEESILKIFGIYNWDENYKEKMLNLLEEQVGGYYDPEKKTMYLSDWLPDSVQETILAHELFHAVQDKNYDIFKYLRMDNKNSDAKVAVSSLLEGEATAIMMDYMLVMKMGKKEMEFDKIPNLEKLMEMQMKMQNSSMPTLASSPKMIQHSLIFPYIKGLSFVKYIKQKSGWKGLNDTYKRVPVSTEQILHPEKYLSGEKPIEVTLKESKKLFKDSEFLGETVLGESFFYTLFNTDDIDKTDKDDANGWGGDKVFVYRKGDKIFSLLAYESDSEELNNKTYDSLNMYLKSKNLKNCYTSLKNGKKSYFLMNFPEENCEKALKKLKL